jgi:ATP-binding cassette subfamily F protein uup
LVLLSLTEVSIAFDGPPLLERVSIQLEEGEKVCLMGRNGSGKSTLLNIIGGSIPPDAGSVSASAGLKISMLPQDIPDDLPGTIYDVVAAGGGHHLDLLKEYRDLTARLGRGGDERLVKQLGQVQHRLETSGAWSHHQKVEAVISRTSLDPNAEFRALSAGLKRRVFLARALVTEPDILLLDEPTNHLDLASILWLEEFLAGFNRTVVFVTHDRAFMQKLATRIVEIDRAKLLSFSCDYRTYLERRQAMLDAEEKGLREFDRRLALEETWIRRGVRARRTRNEGRVRDLMRMRTERAAVRDRTGYVRMVIQEAEAGGRLVVEADGIRFSYGDKCIIDDFSTVIFRGDRVGIIGPNGSGKTTLIKVLLGELAPQKGKIRLGARVQIAYFDQTRAQIDDNLTLKENVSGANDTVFIGGNARNITGYLQDFLFSRDQIVSPARKLSGGERNRLLLARIFASPSNVLVLDEPTNDLDAETLELLEEKIGDYSGTVLMVSHDRAFLNEIVTSTIALEGNGRLQEYVGGYDDWLMQRPAPAEPEKTGETHGEPPKRERQAREKSRLNYKEQRELDALPAAIETLENEKSGLVARLNDPAFQTTGDSQAIVAAHDRLVEVEAELDAAYHRWHELEELAAMYAASGQKGR